MGKPKPQKSFSEEMYVISAGVSPAFFNREGFIFEPHPVDSPDHKCKVASINNDIFECWKTRYLYEAQRVMKWIRKETKLKGLSVKKIRVCIDIDDKCK